MTAQVSTITISAVNYSVYAFATDAVQSATDYVGGRLDSDAWTSATTANKQKALITAARYLDRHVLWAGEKTVSSQELQFPRDGLEDQDGNALADNTIPDEIVEAEFELAILMLSDSSLQSASGAGSNVKVAKAGSAQVEFFRPTLGTGYDTPFPTAVWDLVKFYVASSGAAVAAMPTAEDSGDEASSFGTCNRRDPSGFDTPLL